MPVPTTRKRSRRVMINAGQPTADFLRFNTASRGELATALGWFSKKVAGGSPRRFAVANSGYRERIAEAKAAAARYQLAQAAGEPNIFA